MAELSAQDETTTASPSQPAEMSRTSVIAHPQDGIARLLPVADMNNRAKVIAAVGACALTGIALAALALPIELPSVSSALLVADHHQMTKIPFGRSDPDPSEPTFYSEMAKVNARMHEGMDIAPSTDVDRDFIRMMIPHHQGAIDMALVQLKYGRNEKLRRLAQTIIVEQGQEIAYMRSLLDPPAEGHPASPQSHR
jgi:DUF305 family protein family protein